ncbi:MAG: hypothetical protein WC748_00990 [Legionellales bacterium]|jgi:hypothetical protein
MNIQFLKISAKVPRMLFLLLIITALFIVFVPVHPHMPASGLDSSWVYGMNEAVSQGLVFGKDLIFTFGPYASIYTKTYHLATDHLMLLGSLYLAIAYMVAFLFLARSIPLRWLVLFGVFFAGLMHSGDALLFSYPLLIALITYRMMLPDEHPMKIFFNKHAVLLVIFLFSPFGLLPLIKGSLLFISVAIAGLCFLMFWINKKRLLASMCVLGPCVAAIFFWLVSGQPLLGLPYYFLNMLPISSGYTEAMSLQGNVKETMAYLIAVTGILYIIITTKNVPWRSRLFLFLAYFVFLFLSFKAGFVRHDGHAMAAAMAILMATLFLSLSLQHKHLVMIFLLSGCAWAMIDKRYVQSSTLSVYNNIKNNYKNIGHGLATRFLDENAYQDRYTESLNVIKKQFPIPSMQGTADIYSYQQAYLLASENTWSPRPIFQSYSAYTPKLAQLNEAHLTSERAPDNILFRVETIDQRLPSLDDGLSWPTIINNYEPNKFENNYVYLTKKAADNTTPLKHKIYNQTHMMGEEVLLPATPDFLFAEIDIKPTFIGRLMSILYKPSQLEITLILNNGESRNYRIISSMAKSGFLISPLVSNSKEFSLLFTNTLVDNDVKSISILSTGSSIYWRSKYQLKLSTFESPISLENKI